MTMPFAKPPTMKRQTSVTDHMLASVEVYNHHEKHTVVMKRDRTADAYLIECRKWLGPHTAELPPGTRVLLPHQYYASYFKGSDELAPVTAIFGNSIGKGETLPSPPAFHFGSEDDVKNRL